MHDHRKSYKRIKRMRRGTYDRDLLGIFVILAVWASVFIGVFVWAYMDHQHMPNDIPTADDIAVSSVNLVPLGE